MAGCVLAMAGACVHQEVAPAPRAPPAATSASPQWLFPVCVNGKWGFIDETGRSILPPTFDHVSGGFYHGIAKVVKEGRTCSINKSGAVIWRSEAVEPPLY
jgi:hypothetical protein